MVYCTSVLVCRSGTVTSTQCHQRDTLPWLTLNKLTVPHSVKCHVATVRDCTLEWTRLSPYTTCCGEAPEVGKSRLAAASSTSRSSTKAREQVEKQDQSTLKTTRPALHRLAQCSTMCTYTDAPDSSIQLCSL